MIGFGSLLFFAMLAVVLAAVVVLTLKILQKAGYSAWWCIPSLVPGLNLILIWVFAYTRWPRLSLPPEDHS